MKTKEERLHDFFGTEITISLSRQKLQRLYDVFKKATENRQDCLKDLEPEERLKQVDEILGDRSILQYLEWILRQND